MSSAVAESADRPGPRVWPRRLAAGGGKDRPIEQYFGRIALAAGGFIARPPQWADDSAVSDHVDDHL